MKLIRKVTNELFEFEFFKGEACYITKEPFYSIAHKILESNHKPDEFLNYTKEIHELLFKTREKMIAELPTDMEWWEAQIETEEFRELDLIKQSTWQNTFGKNISVAEVCKAIQWGKSDRTTHSTKSKAIQQALQKDFITTSKNLSLGKLILISSKSKNVMEANDLLTSKKTILEGNHRIVAFELTRIETGQSQQFPELVLVGLSAKMDECKWHVNELL